MDTPSSPRSQSSARRLWRFSLRGLLLFILATAVVFASLGWRWRRAQLQATALERLRATGVASVWYDFEIHTLDEEARGVGTTVPQWLRQLLGDDFFFDVHALQIGPGPQAGIPADRWKAPIGPRGISEAKVHEALELAAPLTQIRSLSIHNAVVRRSALEKLTCWSQLSNLHIDGCDVRDEDLAPLSRAVNVKSVALLRQPIGDAALNHLRPMRQLEQLGLGVTDVTDNGLAELVHLPELEVLWLNHTNVTDEGMVHIAQCKRLRFLELSSTRVGDDGMRHLAALGDLSYLNVMKTHVTDAGVAHLAPLSRLKEGLFGGTTVTQAGVNQVPSLVKSGSYNFGKPVRRGNAASSP